MVDKGEAIFLLIVLLIALMIIVPCMYDNKNTENFSVRQRMDDGSWNGSDNLSTRANSRISMPNRNVPRPEEGIFQDGLTAFDPDANNNDDKIRLVGNTQDRESLIFDSDRGVITTGSAFMRDEGIIAPLWIPPAWSDQALGPSATGELDPADYENDPRMLYNKCSLSCCSPQYPTPFGGVTDPFVCDKNGNSKYLASNYYCTNNAGRSGCLCMTEKQAEGLENGFVDYKQDYQLELEEMGKN